jgi:hypothetical protein
MLLVNATLGFHEEYKAKKSLDELSKELESEIACRRNGETLNVNVKELVPGDIVLLVGGTVGEIIRLSSFDCNSPYLTALWLLIFRDRLSRLTSSGSKVTMFKSTPLP